MYGKRIILVESLTRWQFAKQCVGLPIVFGSSKNGRDRLYQWRQSISDTNLDARFSRKTVSCRFHSLDLLSTIAASIAALH